MTEQAENCDNNLTNQKLSLSVPLADDTNPTSIDELPTELVAVIRMNDGNSNSKEQLHSKSHCKSDRLEHKVRCKEEELMGTKEVQGRTFLDQHFLEQKTEVNDALNKSKVQKSDLELGINKSKTEEAGLNDGLHQDEKIFPMVTEHKQALAAEEKGEPYVQVIDTTREKVISCLKADKDVLENSLYEVKEQARQLEVRNEQLIGENQDLIIGKENLQVEITRLRENKDNEKVLFDLKFENLNLRLAQLESNKQMAITQEKQVHKDAVDRLSKEMVSGTDSKYS
ncbi:ciliary rootlet coiled-coil protein 2-like [Mytilus edulis]|uniref:ciliary rootlet coiled-coil protein 2-like n=1 Tax=Mytilus edulis TaxID=6550 RepID=UPI0039EFE514